MNERLRDRLGSVLLGVALLAGAEFSARNELVSTLILPAPSQVWGALQAGFARGIYWEHGLSTLSASAGGFLIAAVAAIAVAGLLTALPVAERIVLPFIIAFQTLPKVAIAPLLLLWLGFGQASKIAIVTIVCFFPILVNSLQGLRVRDQNQMDLLRSLKASKWQSFRFVRAPNSLPYVFGGLHIAVVFSLLGAVVAEFVGSSSGLGFLLLSAKAQFNVPGVFAVLFILMVLGMVLHMTMLAVERRVTFWVRDLSNVVV